MTHAKILPISKLRGESKTVIDRAIDGIHYYLDELETVPVEHVTTADLEAFKVIRRRLLKLMKTKRPERRKGQPGRYTVNVEGRFGKLAYEMRADAERNPSWIEIYQILAEQVEIEGKQTPWTIVRGWAKSHAAKNRLPWPIGAKGRHRSQPRNDPE